MKRTILVVACLLGLCSCGGGSTAPSGLAPTPASGHNVTPGTGPTLGLLRSASGVPLGVEVTWPRVDVVGVQGYYIYRDSASFPDGPPTGFEGKRANGGGIINSGNPGSGTAAQTFDDLFSAAAGSEYFYRLTVVNSSGDESDFSAELNITIAQQTITTVSQAGGDIGDQVTIDGTWFGDNRNGDQVFFSDSAGNIDVPVVATDYVSWSMTEIVVKVPYGAADGKVAVMIGPITVDSPDGQVFDYNEPNLTSVAPGQDRAENNWITLTGSHFGPAPDSGGTATKVWFDNVAAQDSDIDMASWSTTNITLKVPTDAPGRAVQIKVDVAGNLSGGQSFTVLPFLVSLSVSSGTPGTSVSLNGSGFGPTQGTGSVKFLSANATVTNWTNTQVTVTVPDNAVDGGVILFRDDGKNTLPTDFDVVPRIDSIDPFRRVAGESLTIIGAGFGTLQGGSSVTFLNGSLPPGSYVSWSATQIVVTVPATAATGALRVHIFDNPVGADLDSADSQPLTILLPPPSGWGTIGQL